MRSCTTFMCRPATAALCTGWGPSASSETQRILKTEALQVRPWLKPNKRSGSQSCCISRTAPAAMSLRRAPKCLFKSCWMSCTAPAQSQMLHTGTNKSFTLLRTLCGQDFLPKARCCTKASPRHSRSCEASADKIVSPNGHTQPTLPKPKAAQRLPKDIHALANPLQTRFHPKNQMLHTGTDKTYIHALASPLQTRLSPNGHNPLCHNSWLRRGANETLTLLLLRPLRKQDVILKARCCIKAPARYSHSLRTFCRQDCLPKRPQPTLP